MQIIGIISLVVLEMIDGSRYGGDTSRSFCCAIMIRQEGKYASASSGKWLRSWPDSESASGTPIGSSSYIQ